MLLQDNIEKIVRLLPRPMMNGKLIAKSRNFWLIVDKYGEEDGIVVLNKIYRSWGQDSVRQHPKMAGTGLWSFFLRKCGVAKMGLTS